QRDDTLSFPSRSSKFFGDNATARRIVDRLTFGFTRFELDLLKARGLEGYLRYHFHPQLIDDSALDAYLAANFPVLAMTPQQLGAQSSIGDGTNQLIRARLMRAIFSKRQLLERLVE